MTKGAPLAAAVLVATIASVGVPASAGAARASAPGSLPGSIWGVAVEHGRDPLLKPRMLARLSRARVNALVAAPGGAASAWSRPFDRAAKAGLVAFRPVAEPAACAAAAGERCVVLAKSPASALALAGGGTADVTMVRVSGPSAVAGLARTGGRVLAIVPLRAPVRPGAWRSAIGVARRSPLLDLAIAPAGPRRTAALGAYLRLLGAAVDSGDGTAPPAPAGLAATASGASAAALAWRAAAGTDGVVRYGVYLDGRHVDDVTGTATTVTGLSCGRSHLLEVDAVDRPRNRSPKASTRLTTTCPAPPALAPPVVAPLDTTPPSTVDLNLSSTVAGTVVASWLPATDPGGIAGYDVYADGRLLGSTGGTTFTATGLSCGTMYGFFVVARDRAGNASTSATKPVRTRLCADVTPPSSPSGLAAGSLTQTGLTLSWGASSDATGPATDERSGLAGYDVLLDGQKITALDAAATGYAVSGLGCDEPHAFAVRARDAAGNAATAGPLAARTSPCPADTTPPSTVSSLAAAPTRTTLSLTWTAATDDRGVVAYEVFDGATKLGETTTTAFEATNLSCGTSYTLTVRGRDAAGNTGGGTNVTQSTSQCPDLTPPSAVTNLAERSTTTTTIDWSWSAATDDRAIDRYDVYLGNVLKTSTTATSAITGGLTCGTSYTVTIKARDTSGNVGPGASHTASTLSCLDTSPPSKVSNLAASATRTTLALTWSAATDDRGVDVYEILRGTLKIGESATTAFEATNLACGTPYTLTVRARDMAGNTGQGTDVTKSTSECPDTTLPSAVGNLVAGTPTASSVPLSWTAATDDRGVEEYEIYLGTELIATTALTSHTVTSLDCATTHTLSVRARDAAGNLGPPAQVTVTTGECPDVTQPSPVTGLAVGTVTASTVPLTWSAATDDRGVVGYDVDRNGTTIATPAGTSYTDTGLGCGTTSTYGVRARDAAGNLGPRATVVGATTPCPDDVPPAAPTGLQVTVSQPTSLTVAWKAATDNVGVTGYDVLRDGVVVATPTASPQRLSGLLCGSTYEIAVRARDAAGNRSPAASVSGSTKPCGDTLPPTAPTGLAVTLRSPTSLTVSWTAATDNVGVSGYRVYRDGVFVGATATETTFVVGGLACDTAYTIGVEAFDAANNTSVERPTVSDSTSPCPDTKPTAPTNLRVAQRTTTSVTLAWDPSVDDRPGLVYDVFRNGTKVATTGLTSQKVEPIPCGTSSSFGVEARDTAGQVSDRVALTASTSECADTTAPTDPVGVAATSGDGRLRITWGAATDDRGVTGYSLYLDGGRVADAGPLARSHTFRWIECGATHQLAVDATDAAGNRSRKSMVQATALPCPGPADVFVSPDGSDASPCTEAEPCRTIARGYLAAQPGETVELGGGLYTGQSELPLDPSKGAEKVTVRRAAGATLSIESLDVFARHVTLHGLTIERDFYVKCGAEDITLDHSRAGLFFIGAKDVTLRDSEFGPWVNKGSVINACFDPDDVPEPVATTNVVLDDVYMHDYTTDPFNSVHDQCLSVDGVSGLTIRNSRFWHCEDFDILFKRDGRHNFDTEDVTIENSFFSDPWPDGSSGIQFSAPASGATFTNVLIRNNSFYGSLTPKIEDIISYRNFRVIGNVGPRGIDCANGIVSAYNVWENFADPNCPTDLLAPMDYVDPDAGDLHLRPGAAAIDHGDPLDAPKEDIDGELRPAGEPDAGADEAD